MVKDISSLLTTLKTRLSNNESAISSNNSAIDTNTDDVTNNKGEVGTVEGKIADVQNLRTGVEGQLSALQASLNGIEDDAERVAIDGDIRELEAEISDFKAQEDSFTDTKTDLVKEGDALAKTGVDLGVKGQDLDGENTVIKDDIAEAEADMEAETVDDDAGKPDAANEEDAPFEFSFNGEIDEDTFQQNIGDCWLLSDVRALSGTEFGAQAIRDALDYDHAGTAEDPYTVTLYDTNGERRVIELTREDLMDYGSKTVDDNGSYLDFSVGDADMRLLEAGVAKYFRQEIAAGNIEDRSEEDPLDGGSFNMAYRMEYMLTGREAEILYNRVYTSTESGEEIPENLKISDENLSRILNNFINNTGNVSMTCAFNDFEYGSPRPGLSDGNTLSSLDLKSIGSEAMSSWNMAAYFGAISSVPIPYITNDASVNRENMRDYFSNVDSARESAMVSAHEYSISNVTLNNAGEISSVTIVNPWNTSQSYTIPYDLFKNNLAAIKYLENK
ncbi:hypothetical protein IJ818_04995 [bacterium]|nr:hypothetical protein [bacterium]